MSAIMMTKKQQYKIMTTFARKTKDTNPRLLEDILNGTILVHDSFVDWCMKYI